MEEEYNAPISLADRRYAKYKKQWTSEQALEKARAIHAPSVKVLPFVARNPKHPLDAPPLTWWNDAPGIDHKLDHKRGRAYATMLVDALAADKCGASPLEAIFKSIVDDAVARKVKGGKHSRTLPPAVDGFLWELSKTFVRSLEPETPDKAG